MKKPVKARKLDVFSLLSAIDRKDREYFDQQPLDAQKEFSPRVVLMWLSTVEGPLSEYYLAAANEIINADLDELRDYPDLVYRLMTVCGAGRSQRHQWIDMPKSVRANGALESFMLRFHPLASNEELRLILSRYTIEDFNDFVRHSGVNSSEEKIICDAFSKNY